MILKPQLCGCFFICLQRVPSVRKPHCLPGLTWMSVVLMFLYLYLLHSDWWPPIDCITDGQHSSTSTLCTNSETSTFAYGHCHVGKRLHLGTSLCSRRQGTCKGLNTYPTVLTQQLSSVTLSLFSQEQIKGIMPNNNNTTARPSCYTVNGTDALYQPKTHAQLVCP